MAALRDFFRSFVGAPSEGSDWLTRSRPGTKGFTWPTQDGFIPAGAANRHYHGDTDDALASNVVMSPVNWITRNFTEAEAVVEVKRDDLWERDDDHKLTAVLAQPNPYYGDTLLWKATILSYCIDGNAYWQKVRNRFGEVLGFWYLPHFLVEPKWDIGSGSFIDRYEYRPMAGEAPVDLNPRDVVHFRNGLDPMNTRKGLSPMKPLLREVFTDEEAASFSAMILGNMGVPGGVISPKEGGVISAAEAEKMKTYMSSYRGYQRGEWLVVGQPTNIAQFGFDPNNLTLGNIRDISEERVCAALGVPAAVVGFGAGLQQTKVGATMRELRKEAWNSCIRPMQRDTAKQLGQQALPDFVVQLRRFRVRFDASDFAASQEEESEKADRVGKLVERGVLRVDRAQKMLGLEIDPSRQVYLGPAPAPDEPEEPKAPAQPAEDLLAIRERVTSNGRGNGNG